MSQYVCKGEGYEWLPDTLQGLKEQLGLTAGEFSGYVELAGREFYLKYTAVAPKTRLKAWFRTTGPLVKAPRVVEFENLVWLRAAGLPAPEAALVITTRRWGVLTAQLLMTARLLTATNLRCFLQDRSGPADRWRVLLRVGAEVGRLHEAGFFHRDLYPRNVLVDSPQSPHVYFLDCHRGTPRPILRRRAAYDLGNFDLWAPTLLTEAERSAFFSAYVLARPGVDPTTLLRRVSRRREHEVARYSRKRYLPFDLCPASHVPEPNLVSRSQLDGELQRLCAPPRSLVPEESR